MARNLSAFDQGQDLPIVNVASGCGAMLKEYRDTVASPEAERFSARIRDIGQYLEQVPWPENLRLRPLPAKVCLHSPCSLRNVLRAERQAAALLKRIPELNLIAVPAQIRCCGAAGSYALEQPVMAENIREASLDWILAQQPDYLATSNPGCAVHLRAGLAKRGYRNIQVLHPVTLIARQLDA
jgi:glycolate oxidase iron-sulfur subunit